EAIARLVLRRMQLAAGPIPSPWAAYLHDPVGFMRDVLHETLWRKQVEISEAVDVHRRVAVHSAHECSKSFTAARLVAWWLSVHDFGEAFAVTTAPTATQVRSILWREIGRAYRAGKLPGRLNQTEWFMLPGWQRYGAPKTGEEELVAIGRKPSDYSPAAFQGLHSRYVLLVVDEACGVPESIWQAAASLTANEHSRTLAIGNPDISFSHFATVCKPDSGWHVIHVDGLQSPNFTDERETLPPAVLEQLISQVYIDELAADVGEDSPIFASKVRGLFSEDNSAGVVPLSFVRRCQDPERVWPDGSDLPIELGMDVGAGGDETAIRERRGVHAGRSWHKKTPDWKDAVAVALEAIAATGATAIKVDTIGIGWGVVGRLKELRAEKKHNAEVIGVNVGESSRRPDRFPKLRDQIWWEVGRQLSQDHAWDLSAVDERTVAQLTAPLYDADSSNRVKVEPKVKTRERIKRSPDDADALLLAYYTGSGKANVRFM
ncbi:MAG: hypothetical protein WC718_18615, partial [Phycisphaerales bacterium]